MQCDICNKETGSLLACDRCSKRVCKECSEQIGGNTVCRECVSRRNCRPPAEKKGLAPPHYLKVMGHGGVIAIIAFWALVGISYLAVQKAPSLTGGDAAPAAAPVDIGIAGYVPVCDAGGSVYLLELSVSNAGARPASVETIVINEKNAGFDGVREIPAKGSRAYAISAQDIFGGGFSRSSPPRGASILVVTNRGSASGVLVTNPASCVQR